MTTEILEIETTKLLRYEPDGILQAVLNCEDAACASFEVVNPKYPKDSDDPHFLRLEVIKDRDTHVWRLWHLIYMAYGDETPLTNHLFEPITDHPYKDKFDTAEECYEYHLDLLKQQKYIIEDHISDLDDEYNLLYD